MNLNKLIISLLALVPLSVGSVTVGQATSVAGHQVVFTNEPCTVVSGRSSQRPWGRTFSYLPNGTTVTGCGRLDNDTVLVEWYIPPATLDIRRYPVSHITWSEGYGNK